MDLLRAVGEHRWFRLLARDGATEGLAGSVEWVRSPETGLWVQVGRAMDRVRLWAARARGDHVVGRVMGARMFVLGREDEDDAWTETHRFAAVLVRHRITGRYGVSVHKAPGHHGAWGGYLTDRTPELGPPPLLVIRALRSFGLAA
ncbi:hypothetical protein E2C11_22000 [Streptomyces lavendulae]|nr:hypothetical protein [Streptomyces lavendulae]TXJ76438.1 hypothetical protein E2C11_22000 [Streptomyces lavendulae]